MQCWIRGLRAAEDLLRHNKLLDKEHASHKWIQQIRDSDVEELVEGSKASDTEAQQPNEVLSNLLPPSLPASSSSEDPNDSETRKALRQLIQALDSQALHVLSTLSESFETAKKELGPRIAALFSEYFEFGLAELERSILPVKHRGLASSLLEEYTTKRNSGATPSLFTFPQPSSVHAGTKHGDSCSEPALLQKLEAVLTSFKVVAVDFSPASVLSFHIFVSDFTSTIEAGRQDVARALAQLQTDKLTVAAELNRKMITVVKDRVGAVNGQLQVSCFFSSSCVLAAFHHSPVRLFLFRA